VSGLGTNHVQSLAEWLEIATADLCVAAKERIRLEIEAHFADSMEIHQANSCSEADAQTAALAELGDASAAAKRFRNRHLTEKEAKRVVQMLKCAGGSDWLLISYSLYGLFYFYFFEVLKWYQAPLVFPIVALFLCLVFHTIGFFVARHKRSESGIRFVLLTPILPVGWLTLFSIWVGIWGHWTLLFAMMPGLTIILVRDLRLWFKLGRLDTLWPKMPSRGAPAP